MLSVFGNCDNKKKEYFFTFFCYKIFKIRVKTEYKRFLL